MLRTALLLTSALVVSCAGSGTSDLRTRVSWSLNEPSATIPDDVDQLSVDIWVGDETDPLNSLHTVANLEDADGNGRNELVRGNLPTGVDIRMRIQGLSGGAVRYVGHAGPFVLQVGERRYVDLAMYPIGQWQAVERATLRGRFLHTATPLPDGRVLVAGGFTSAMRATSCPATFPAETRCHVLTASDDAWIFDPATGRFHEVEGGMLEARAGHTATTLASGGVLIAGGARAAILAFVPQGGTPATGYSISVLAIDAMDASTASATFEIFDPEANPELEDIDADGDPGRGGFVGAADAPTRAGRLDRARFLAAAARVPGTTRAVIAGGVGEADSATTFTVFDGDRAGGYGVLAVATPMLAAQRVAAGATGVGTGSSAAVWIVGGSAARSDADLAEVWQGTSMDPAGASASAATAPLAFPQQEAGGTASHPEWNLVAPIVVPIDGGDHVLVAGWYGPRCDPAMASAVVFEGAADPLEQCGFSTTSVRNFTIDVSSGLAQPTPLGNAHAFGAAAQLDDGRVVITGGINTITWVATNTIDVLTGDVDADGVAERATGSSPTMRGARVFHTSTALPDGGVLTVGGITFGALDLSAISPIASPEVLYL